MRDGSGFDYARFGEAGLQILVKEYALKAYEGEKPASLLTLRDLEKLKIPLKKVGGLLQSVSTPYSEILEQVLVEIQETAASPDGYGAVSAAIKSKKRALKSSLEV